MGEGSKKKKNDLDLCWIFKSFWPSISPFSFSCRLTKGLFFLGIVIRHAHLLSVKHFLSFSSAEKSSRRIKSLR